MGTFPGSGYYLHHDAATKEIFALGVLYCRPGLLLNNFAGNPRLNSFAANCRHSRLDPKSYFT